MEFLEVGVQAVVLVFFRGLGGVVGVDSPTADLLHVFPLGVLGLVLGVLPGNTRFVLEIR